MTEEPLRIVKGQLTARFMAQSAGLDLFASKPEQ
jgi:hypothetical protein